MHITRLEFAPASLLEHTAHDTAIAVLPDEVEWQELLLTAPAGGSISNVNLQEGVLRAPMVETTLYGLDVWAGVVQADPGSTATVTYDVTTSPNAAADLTIHQTPTCQTFE